MSWLRLAEAVGVGKKNNLTRTVRNYTDSIVQHAGQAVAEGIKRFQDCMLMLGDKQAEEKGHMFIDEIRVLMV